MTLDRYVIDIMTPNPVVVGAETTAWAAECLAEERNVHHLIVLDHYDLVGEVCRCDLRGVKAEMRVHQCMKTPPVTIEDQRTADDALGVMSRCGVGCLPVVDWIGTLHGVVTRRDLRRAGILHEKQAYVCASCGSAHGVGPTRGDGETVFCVRCVEQARPPRTPIEHMYFTAGGCD